ncbi:3'-5' exonuclease [Duganella sp. FT27W]|uniref:3'-5' exonuclease n=1 Tax=Duganella sp. FT27W TaxID=2654636 RepID=UPI00128E4724|nr:3'-5' exonuclease [Duganella sp. FT27W]MPQ56377.1 3'-5' exonuclease [Duganella sp. FT27W]
MLITGLDTETTGLDPADGHRIIEIALLTYDSDTRKLVDQYVQRIDPERAISAGAQEVHGIAYNELVGMPKWNDVAPIIVERLKATDLAIAHNMDFDGPFIGLELVRVGQAVPNFDTFCTMKNGRWAAFDGKSPKLIELCFALGVEYDKAKAHAADYDVEVMMECFWRGLDRGFYRPDLLTAA